MPRVSLGTLGVVVFDKLVSLVDLQPCGDLGASVHCGVGPKLVVIGPVSAVDETP